MWYVTLHLIFSRVIYCTVYAFQVTYNPEVSDNTYIDTLEWTVKTPGLIKCFANNSEGSSSETVSLFITGKLISNTNQSIVNTKKYGCINIKIPF